MAESLDPMDNWLSEYDSLDEFACEVMMKINQRSQFQMNTIAYSRNDVQVRQMLKNFQDRVNKLSERLMRSASALTQREAERRQRLLDNLNHRSKQMDYAINNPDAAGRTALLGNHLTQASFGPGSSTSFDDDIETNAARNLNAEEMKQQQKMLLQAQDKGLDSLGEIITRQKYMAQGINREIDLQNEIIDDVGDAMDQTNVRLVRNTRNVRLVDRKADTCCYWVVIIALFVAIVVVSFV